MSQRGVHFALLPTDVQKLRNAQNDEQLLMVIRDNMEGPESAESHAEIAEEQRTQTTADQPRRRRE